MDFNVGDSFKSYEELNNKSRQYEELHFISVYKWDNLTIEAAKKKGLKRTVNDNLKYKYVTYRCYHGGRNFRSHSKGIRPNQR